MMLYFTQNRHDYYFKIFGLLRYSIFIFFYILSIRLIFVSIDYAPIKNPFLLVIPLFAIAILSCWKTLWSLYAFVVAIPLVSGLQVLGFLQPVPFLSLIFASIYLSWLSKRLFFKKEGISPRTAIGNLVDILSGIVLLSLILTLGFYPLDLIWNRIWFFPSGMNETFYSVEAAYVLLQGLFFYRMMELEAFSQRALENIILVLYIQASIIIFFSMTQLIFRIPGPHFGFAIFAPFEDIHSYGSYIAVLFLIFLSMMRGGFRHKLFTGVCTGFFLLFAVLSYSRATWLVVVIVLSVFIIHKLSIRKKTLLISCMFLILLYLNLFPNILIKSNEDYIRRLGQLVVVKELTDSAVEARFVLWKRALNIISDFPITGSGIGTFYRISPIYHDLSVKDQVDFYENAHNYFLQFASDLGLPALIVLMSVLFFTYKVGFTVISRNDESSVLVKGLLFGLSAYLITCMTGHPLLLSNQQFLFWFMISSIILPYRFTTQRTQSDEKSLKSPMFFFLLVFMVVGAHVYELWGMTGKQQYEYGFYSYELWGEKKVRWTAKKALSRTEVTGNLMSFDVHAPPYNVSPGGLVFKLFINGELWDEVKFTQSDTRKLRYRIPYQKNELIEIKMVVNRTFKPVRLGLNKDSRTLGVAVTEIKFGDEMP